MKIIMKFTKRTFRIIYIPIIFSILTIGLPLHTLSQELECDYNWNRISGNWVSQKNGDNFYVIQDIIPTSQWNLNIIVNHHTIASRKSYQHYSKLVYDLSIHNQKNSFNLLLFFAAELSERSKYQNLFGFNFKGESNKITETSLIKSSIIDPGQPTKLKNFQIINLSTYRKPIPVIEKLKCEILINKTTASLFINGKLVIRNNAKEIIDNGIIGIGVQNAQLKIYDFKIYDGKTLLLHDDFSSNKIYSKKIIMQRVPSK